MLENKLQKAKSSMQKNVKTKKCDKAKIAQLERKLLLAKKFVTSNSAAGGKRKEPTERAASQPRTKKRKKLSTKKQESLQKEKKKLEQLLIETQTKLDRLQNENSTLQMSLDNAQKDKEKLLSMNAQLKLASQSLQEQKFSYDSLVKKPKIFKYMCGLSVEQFKVLWLCAEPYSHLIKYPDCKGNAERSLDKATQLLAVLTLCKHALHQGVVAFILGVGTTTVHHIFTGWIVFLDALFNCLDLKPERGFLIKKMPEIFVKTGHGLTDMIIDCTEFKFQHVSNLDLNSLMFSNYKNTITGKALIGIAPHGMGLLFSDIYPGSISDSTITEKQVLLIGWNLSMSSWLIKGFLYKIFVQSKAYTSTALHTKWEINLPRQRLPQTLILPQQEFMLKGLLGGFGIGQY